MLQHLPDLDEERGGACGGIANTRDGARGAQRAVPSARATNGVGVAADATPDNGHGSSPHDSLAQARAESRELPPPYPASGERVRALARSAARPACRLAVLHLPP